MQELNVRYVFHIPCYKRENNKLQQIDTSLIDNLIKQLDDEGYDSLYMTKVRGYYKSRSFDEVLLTIFCSEDSDNIQPDKIFKNWFKNNNHLLKQESFAYEHNNKMVIEKLI